MDLHFVGRDAADLGADPLGASLELGGRPDVHAVRPDVGGAVHRLHRLVREERELIGGLDPQGCRAEPGSRITVVARHDTWLVRPLREEPGDTPARGAGSRPFVPFYLVRV